MTNNLRARALGGVLAALIVGGCATGPQISPDERNRILAPMTCIDKAQCDVLWSRLQAWVASNSKWRIQIANDVTIQTFGPGTSGSTDVAYALVRTPISGGGASIEIRAGCANIFGCFPDPVEAIRQMKAAARP